MNAARWPSRHGFALPLVILLALVAVLAGTLLLELQTNTTSGVNRQAKIYEDHHLAAGMRELVDQWLLTGGGDIAGRLEDDGLAFELDLPQGRTVRVYLEDAQGTVLRELSSIGGATARTLERVIAQLELTLPPPPESTSITNEYGQVIQSGQPGGLGWRQPAPQTPELFRNVGPVPVSVNSAGEAVLEAIAAASDNPDAARALMRHIRARVRPGSRLTKEDFTSLMATITMTPAQSRQLNSLLTAEPVLWRMTIETRHGALTTARVDRSAALIQVPPGGQNLGGAGVVVLSWEDAEAQTGPGDR